MYGLYIYENQAGTYGYTTNSQAEVITTPAGRRDIRGYSLIDIINRKNEAGELSIYFSGEALDTTRGLLSVVAELESGRLISEKLRVIKKSEAARLEREKKSADLDREIEKMNNFLGDLGRLV